MRTGFIARRWLGAGFALAVLVLPVLATAHEQIGFSARDTGAGREFSYRLRDQYTGEVSRLSFTLRRSDLKDTAQGLRPPADVMAANVPKIIARGNQRCEEIGRRYNGRANCTVTPTADGSYQIGTHYSSGVDRAAVERDVQRLLNELQSYGDQLFQQGNYALSGSGANRTFALDYAAIAKRAVTAMEPVARAVKSADIAIPQTPNARRIALSRAIAFFQAIPYEVLGKQRSSGMGFLTPLAVIAENRGDCDSKAVAYAATARTLAPGTPVAIVVVPGHALVGLGISPERGDATLTQGGITYVLAEPVGPAPARIGEVGPLSRDGLRNSSKVQLIRVF